MSFEVYPYHCPSWVHWCWLAKRLPLPELSPYLSFVHDLKIQRNSVLLQARERKKRSRRNSARAWRQEGRKQKPWKEKFLPPLGSFQLLRSSTGQLSDAAATAAVTTQGEEAGAGWGGEDWLRRRSSQIARLNLPCRSPVYNKVGMIALRWMRRSQENTQKIIIAW